MTEGMSCWRGPRDHEPGQPFSATRPCSWLILNADLLKPKELPSLVAPLEVLRRREGEYEGRMVSAVAARRPRG
jgi:hypothetical protein